MSNCTWKGCDQPATHKQIGRQGQVWAHLCMTHDCILTEAIISCKPRFIMSAYCLACGGAKAIVESPRVKTDIERSVQLVSALQKVLYKSQ